MDADDYIHGLISQRRHVDTEWQAYVVVAMHPEAYYEIAKDVRSQAFFAPLELLGFPLKVSANEPEGDPPRLEVRMPVEQFREIFNRMRFRWDTIPTPAPDPTMRTVAAKWWRRVRGR